MNITWFDILLMQWHPDIFKCGQTVQVQFEAAVFSLDLY